MGVKYLYIHVEAQNAAAERLYQSHGFVFEKEEDEKVKVA
jgi:ribosomal protein S18 acetylase RimI-like enzyme